MRVRVGLNASRSLFLLSAELSRVALTTRGAVTMSSVAYGYFIHARTKPSPTTYMLSRCSIEQVQEAKGRPSHSPGATTNRKAMCTPICLATSFPRASVQP